MTRIVPVGGIACGADALFLISGPCVIEEESVMLRTAEKLREVSERLKVPVIYKSSFTKDNRSSVDFYQGPGLDEGLKVLARIKKDFGFPILTDIHYPRPSPPRKCVTCSRYPPICACRPPWCLKQHAPEP